MYYTYLLRCTDGSLYVGITTDLKRRFQEHLGKGGKGAKYTRARTPAGYEAAWLSPDRSSASRLEYRLKKLNHAEKAGLIGQDLLDHPALPIQVLKEAVS